jgi:hypothetical protein
MPGSRKAETIKGIIAAFAGTGIFGQFEKECGKWPQSLTKIFRLALDVGATASADRQSFIEFISRQTPLAETCEYKSFEQCIDALRGSLSVNGLLDKINRESGILGLPVVYSPLITRLKQHFVPATSRQRCALHLLSYWAGKYRPETGISYNLLSKLAGTPQHRQSSEPHGIVMAINLQSLGSLVSTHAVNWLSTQLGKSIQYLRLHYLTGKGSVEPFGASSVILKLAEQKSTGDDLRAYAQPIRDSLALAHQMAVHWRLSPHSKHAVGMTIAIHAGKFSETTLGLPQILELRHSSNPAIVLTDMAYLCARIADVKVGFCRYDTVIQSEHIKTGKLWTPAYFWAHTYHDYVESLLSTDAIPFSATDANFHLFQRDLFSFSHLSSPSMFSAINVAYSHPVSTIVLLEIAKVCLARCMFREADHFLSLVLIDNPNHCVARVMRILVYLNIGVRAATNDVANRNIERAISESNILRSQSPTDPEVWCEIGLIYFWKAFRVISVADKATVGAMYTEALSLLGEAHECFAQGSIASPWGLDNRCLFWQVYTESMQELCTSNKNTNNVFFQKDTGISDTSGIFIRCSARFFSFIGWIDTLCAQRAETEKDVLNIISEEDILSLISNLKNHIAIYENAALSRSYVPDMLYAISCVLWDFLPNLTADICHCMFDWLYQARAIAELCKKDNLAIFSCADGVSLYQAPDDFIACIDATIQAMLAHLPRNFAEKDNHAFLPQASARKRLTLKLLLMTSNRDFQDKHRICTE